MPIKSGNLFNEIIIQEPSESKSTLGEVTFTWATYRAVYAEIMQNSGREIINADQVDAFFDSSFKIRADESTGIRTSMRILYKTRVYNIVHIKDPDERGVEQLILTKRQEDQVNG